MVHAHWGTLKHQPTMRQTDPMEGWLVGLGAALGCMVAIWLALILARKLPPGLLRDLATFIPDCVTAVRRLHRDPRVPRRAKVAMLIAGLWVASPSTFDRCVPPIP
jgi:hypothetical protein